MVSCHTYSPWNIIRRTCRWSRSCLKFFSALFSSSSCRILATWLSAWEWSTGSVSTTVSMGDGQNVITLPRYPIDCCRLDRPSLQRSASWTTDQNSTGHPDHLRRYFSRADRDQRADWCREYQNIPHASWNGCPSLHPRGDVDEETDQFHSSVQFICLLASKSISCCPRWT